MPFLRAAIGFSAVVAILYVAYHVIQQWHGQQDYGQDGDREGSARRERRWEDSDDERRSESRDEVRASKNVKVVADDMELKRRKNADGHNTDEVGGTVDEPVVRDEAELAVRRAQLQKDLAELGWVEEQLQNIQLASTVPGGPTSPPSYSLRQTPPPAGLDERTPSPEPLSESKLLMQSLETAAQKSTVSSSSHLAAPAPLVIPTTSSVATSLSPRSESRQSDVQSDYGTSSISDASIIHPSEGESHEERGVQASNQDYSAMPSSLTQLEVPHIITAPQSSANSHVPNITSPTSDTMQSIPSEDTASLLSDSWTDVEGGSERDSDVDDVSSEVNMRPPSPPVGF
ncbi:hypothetical protein HDV00_000133 [Rhizophlyctis rosea]|nr:hypothetical protein HDV00_000133 [Rhizophlyctis rosea]